MITEFKDFLFKTNALALAVGVIIGATTGKVVSAVVDDLIMPPIAMIMPPGDWRDAQIELSRAKDADGKVTVNAIKYGHFAGTMVDFVTISFVVFLLGKTVLPKPESPSNKACPECLETIAKEAKRCKFCTSAVA
ncbi:large conductance mechanosensitive channel protein MscL [Candidatus Obscuribacterales bacterium]|nr:large conductance mechanosensitive channel protein MscL [Candidatus Obscuribacterales bacterium]MBX3136512.1 large conductance mechanosensitive channel protein MscL [Candidatus Obscuribacterales bacterium]MBX3151250.1 large conductance mechanosensitive channel protein MscL [Candidatus Obscuribacterales bacterium]